VKGSDFNRNNLDCLRFILAAIVVLFHLYALSGITAYAAFGKYLSPQLAVRSFFVISGLLIYRSYTRSSSVASYSEKRLRRIYPAYFTVVLLAAIALSTLSTLPYSAYFGGGFWRYLGANLLFLNFLAPTLPGVFSSLGVSAVNGALWTLKIEVAFYICVPFIHFLCTRFGTKMTIGAIFLLSCLWRYGFALLAIADASRNAHALDSQRSIYSQLGVQFPAQLIYFSGGILLLVYFDWLKLHFRSIFFITVSMFVVDHWVLNGHFDVVWISGIVLLFGFWRYFGNFSKYGDFSYGLYIVHWPILQAVTLVSADRLSPPMFAFVSLSLVGIAAALMWHLVESRFLASSSHYRLVAEQVHP